MQDISTLPGDSPALGSNPTALPASPASTPLPAPSVADLLAWAETTMGKDAYKAGLVVKRVLPYLATMAGLAQDLSIEALAGTIPADRLFDCFTGKKHDRWTPELIATMPEFGNQKTFAKGYRRALVRVLTTAAKKCFLRRAAFGVAPAWQNVREEILAAGLPVTRKLALEHLAAGHVDFMGIPLVDDSGKPLAPDAIAADCRVIRDGLNKMGRFMTARGIDAPEKITPGDIYGRNDSYYAVMMDESPHAMSTSYYPARKAWDILQQSGHGLVPWPAPGLERAYTLAAKQQNATFKTLVEEVRPAVKGERVEVRVDAIVAAVGKVVGYHLNVKKRDLGGLWDRDNTPMDVAWLILAGYIPKQGRRLPSREGEIERVLHEKAYREELLDVVPEANQRHAAFGLCRANPFVEDLVEWYLAANHADAAIRLLYNIQAILAEYLAVEETQLDWIKRLRARARKAKRGQAPSEHATNKEAIGETKGALWESLVAARPRMATHTAGLRTTMESDPTPHNRRRWASAVLAELLVAFFLAFQIRPGDVEALKLGEDEDVDADNYTVRIPDYKAKAKVGVIKHFGSGGYFADLVPLFDTYLEARTILLEGRDTPYFLVAQKKESMEVFDPDGHLVVGDGFVERTLVRAINRHFRDLLPPRVKRLSPGLFRHIFSTFLYHEGAPEALEAQALGHTPQIASQHYRQIGRLCDKPVADYIRTRSVKARIAKPKLTLGQLRKELLLNITRELLSGTDPAVAKAIARHVDAYTDGVIALRER